MSKYSLRNIGAIILTFTSLNLYSQNNSNNNYRLIPKVKSSVEYLKSSSSNVLALKDSVEYNNFTLHNYITNKFSMSPDGKTIHGENISGFKSKYTILGNLSVAGFVEVNSEQQRRKKINQQKIKRGYTEIDLEYKITKRLSILYHPSTMNKAKRLRQDMNQGLTFTYRLH